MNKKIILFGLLLLVTGILLGAFGAHALKQVLLDFPEKLLSFETGIRYQIYGAFSLLLIGFNTDKLNFNALKLSWFLLTGHLLFSVSIYALALQPVLGVTLKFLGPITPLGGVLIIGSWIIFIYNFLKNK